MLHRNKGYICSNWYSSIYLHEKCTQHFAGDEIYSQKVVAELLQRLLLVEQIQCKSCLEYVCDMRIYMFDLWFWQILNRAAGV